MAGYQKFFVHADFIDKGTDSSVFSARYIITLAVLAALFIILISIYKKLSPIAKRRFMIALAIIMPAIEISRAIWLFAIHNFQITRDLPFQMCRVMLFLYSAAIITDNRKLKTACYALGMPGAVLAFVFPNVTVYPAISYEYMRYMTAHLLLACIPFLWIAGDGFRPAFSSLKWILWVVLFAADAQFGLNAALGSNYLYVNALPEHVDIFIPQPWYTLAIYAFMNVVVILVMLPFYKLAASKNIAQ